MNWNFKLTVSGTGLSASVCGCVSLSLPVPSFPGRPPGNPPGRVLAGELVKSVRDRCASENESVSRFMCTSFSGKL